jgi:hypothetical protein
LIISNVGVGYVIFLVSEMVLSTWVLSKCNCVLGCVARARKFRVIFCCEVLLSVIVHGTALQCLRIPLSVTKTGDKLHSWRGAPHPADIATPSTADSACYLPISCHVSAALHLGGDANVYYPNMRPRVVQVFCYNSYSRSLTFPTSPGRHVDVIKLVAA